MRNVIGKVSESERDEIKRLFGRKNALIDLLKSVEKGSQLYETAMNDYIETNDNFQNWWNRMARKYDWQGGASIQWQIDFNNCEIFLAERKPN